MEETFVVRRALVQAKDLPNLEYVKWVEEIHMLTQDVEDELQTLKGLRLGELWVRDKEVLLDFLEDKFFDHVDLVLTAIRDEKGNRVRQMITLDDQVWQAIWTDKTLTMAMVFEYHPKP